jgi:hypothetical protein
MIKFSRFLAVKLCTAVIPAAMLFLAPVYQPTLAQSDNVFGAFGGSWRGNGQIRLKNGAKENISCRGYYNAKGGAELSIALLCASPSYKIEMRSTLNSSGNRVTGRWEERNFNAEGTVSGSVSANRINLSIGGALTGNMSVSLNGNNQSVDIRTPRGGFEAVTISLSKS